MRFRLVQDDSSHWYSIPADKRAEFDAWCASFEREEEDDDDYRYEGEDFEEYSLNMHPSNYTFEALKEDD
jgi:isopenicillin N synthase-like dioxygenase